MWLHAIDKKRADKIKISINRTKQYARVIARFLGEKTAAKSEKNK